MTIHRSSLIYLFYLIFFLEVRFSGIDPTSPSEPDELQSTIFIIDLFQLFIPRVIGMYALTGLAFLIYLARVPERWFSGRFDYLGHSHNWWHFLVLIALYYWHNSGKFFGY